MRVYTQPARTDQTFPGCRAVASAGLQFRGGCGGITTTPLNPAPFSGTIHVKDHFFDPANVTISAGESVTWKWEGKERTFGDPGHDARSVAPVPFGNHDGTTATITVKTP